MRYVPTTIDAVVSLVPDAKVFIKGKTGELVWIEPAVAPVTDQQITDELARLLAKDLVNKEIAELKAKLAETDYVVLADYDKEKPEVIAQRQQWRDRIRELES